MQHQCAYAPPSLSLSVLAVRDIFTVGAGDDTCMSGRMVPLSSIQPRRAGVHLRKSWQDFVICLRDRAAFELVLADSDQLLDRAIKDTCGEDEKTFARVKLCKN